MTNKQERFAQAVAAGDTYADAYRIAYNVAETIKQKTIHELSSRLMADDKIHARVMALIQREGVTLAKHIKELTRLKELALKAGNYGAAVQAETNIGKASRLYVERHETVTPDKAQEDSELEAIGDNNANPALGEILKRVNRGEAMPVDRMESILARHQGKVAA